MKGTRIKELADGICNMNNEIVGGGDGGSGGNIAVHAGTITANGGWEAAGIGGAEWNDSTRVTINGAGNQGGSGTGAVQPAGAIVHDKSKQAIHLESQSRY